MYTKPQEMLSDLSESAEQTKKQYKGACKCAPRMKKEITVKSSYFSGRSKKFPCAESLFKLDIDCNLLKLILVLLACMLMLSIYCSMRYKKR